MLRGDSGSLSEPERSSWSVNARNFLPLSRVQPIIGDSNRLKQLNGNAGRNLGDLIIALPHRWISV
jgi:hypothetical protein